MPDTMTWKDFCYRFVVAGVAAILWWLCSNVARSLLTPTFFSSMAISYGAAAVPLMLLFWLDSTYKRSAARWVGCINRRLVGGCFVAVLLIYLADHGIGALLGQTREPFMQLVYSYSRTATPAQLSLFVGSLLVLPPIVEELFFRHFVLSIIPFRRNAWLAAAAIALSSTVFTFGHLQYVYATTYASLFGFAVVTGIARVVSGGMLLSILLHSWAVALALVLNYGY